MTMERIIRTAKLLYTSLGISKVSMGRVAKESDISENALYSKFRLKEDLVVACAKREVACLSLSAEYIKEQAGSALEVILFACFDQFYYNCSLYPNFFYDLSFFPEADKLWKNYQYERRKRCTGYLLKGISEGDFVSNHDYELIPIVLSEQLNKLNVQKTVHQKTRIISIIREVCTEKGNFRLMQLLEQKKTI